LLGASFNVLSRFENGRPVGSDRLLRVLEGFGLFMLVTPMSESTTARRASGVTTSQNKGIDFATAILVAHILDVSTQDGSAGQLTRMAYGAGDSSWRPRWRRLTGRYCRENSYNQHADDTVFAF
jgi:hypothetical protein